jgi:uncharacterized protein YbjT (DUF2867 family)
MTGQTMHRPATLVLGGTGRTGRLVAERLMARGVPTRIGPRAGTPPFDWDDRATWAPALRNARLADGVQQALGRAPATSPTAPAAPLPAASGARWR